MPVLQILARHCQEVAECAAAHVPTICDDVMFHMTTTACKRRANSKWMSGRTCPGCIRLCLLINMLIIIITTSFNCCCSKWPRRHQDVDYKRATYSTTGCVVRKCRPKDVTTGIIQIEETAELSHGDS